MSVLVLNPVDWQSKLPTKAQIEGMAAEQLCDVLKLCSTLSDAILQVAAWAWNALEAKGADLSEFIDQSPYLFRRVRDIAHEKLTVEAAMKFGGKAYVLDYVRKLPVERQKQLVENDSVLLVVEREGRLDERKLPLAALERDQLKQLVDERGEIRTPNQQRAYLSPAPTHPESGTPRGKVHIVRGKIRIDGEVPVAVVIKALKEKGFISIPALFRISPEGGHSVSTAHIPYQYFLPIRAPTSRLH